MYTPVLGDLIKYDNPKHGEYLLVINVGQTYVNVLRARRNIAPTTVYVESLARDIRLGYARVECRTSEE